MGKQRSGNTGNVRDVLPPGEVFWIVPDQEHVYWGPNWYRITDHFCDLGITTGEHLMLEKMCRFLFDRTKRSLPPFREIARVMGLSVSAAWRHLAGLVEHGLVDVVERKPGMAHKLSLAPLFAALRRVLGVDAAQEAAHLDNINAALADFAASTHRTIRNVANYRARLDAATSVAGWTEHQLMHELHAMMPAAKVARAVRDPVGYLVRAIEQRAANIGKERFISREEPPIEQAERAQPEEARSTGTQDRTSDESDYSGGPSEQPANVCNAAPESGDAALVADGCGGIGMDKELAGSAPEETITPDSPACIREAFLQFHERGRWPMVYVRADRQGWAVTPSWGGPFGWKAFAERGTEAEHYQALKKLYARLGELKPLAAAGGA